MDGPAPAFAAARSAAAALPAAPWRVATAPGSRAQRTAPPACLRPRRPLNAPAPPPLQVAAWRDHAASSYREVWLPGAEHNYIAEPPPPLLRLVASELGAALAARSEGGAAAAPGIGARRSWSAPLLEALAAALPRGAGPGVDGVAVAPPVTAEAPRGGAAPDGARAAAAATVDMSAREEGRASEESQQPAPGTPQQRELSARSDSLSTPRPGGEGAAPAPRRCGWLCGCLGAARS
jgi:hypothetical protein